MEELDSSTKIILWLKNNTMGAFNFDKNDFEKVRVDAENFYNSIGEVYCPYFGQKIAFNSKGLRHLKFKSDERARLEKDQYARLKLIYFVPEVIKKSHMIQGIKSTKLFEQQKTNGKWKRAMKDVKFYEFIALIEAKNVCIKIIIKEVFGGEKHFFSVIPYWRIDKENQKRILCSGNPEDD